MAFGALIIGDEILSGRRADKHLAKVISLLAERGMQLEWARYVGDDAAQLEAVLRDSFSVGDKVFCFGGIGATPDDRTRQSAAAALGVPLELHPVAEAAIRARFGDQINEHRLQMGVFPQGSSIVPNTYNEIPGFSICEHYFMPGFPVMAWPMVEWVLDAVYPHLHHKRDYIERAIVVADASESGLIDLMERLTRTYPDCVLFSLPSVGEKEQPRTIELGMKGPAARVEAAMVEIRSEVTARGFPWREHV